MKKLLFVLFLTGCSAEMKVDSRPEPTPVPKPARLTMYVNAETDEEAKAFAGYLADKLDWTNMGAFFEKYEITNIQEFKNIV